MSVWVADSQRALDALADNRKAVSDLAISAPEAGARYTNIITTLLALPARLPALSADQGIAAQALAYGAFLQTKEHAGIERATLTNSLSTDRFLPELFVKFVKNIAEQDTWLAVFKQNAHSEHTKFAEENIRGKAVDDVATFKKMAIARANEAALGLDAKAWFAAATARIDLMKEVEDRLAEDMMAAIHTLENNSKRIAGFYAIVTLLAALAVIVVTLLITRRILAQIGGEPETAVSVAHAVADGKLDNEIALAENDQDSILAAMHRMQILLRERIDAERAVAAENLRIKIALDNVSTGVMIADPDRTVIYANPAVRALLKDAEVAIRRQLPHFDANLLVGQNIDVFHRNPTHQAKLLAGLSSPHTTSFEIGERHLTVAANPVIDKQGVRLGTVAEWRDRTAEVLAEREVSNMVGAASRGEFDAQLSLEGKTGFFRQLAEGLNQLSTVVSAGLHDVARMLQRIAQGDLTRIIDTEYDGLFGQLKDDTNTTVKQLRDVVGRIQEATAAINSAAQEIAAGNQDLSARTEDQASSLEETASSMEQLNATVKQNADSARQANDLAGSSNDLAIRGGQMVKQVIATMDGIQASSQKIADIIGVIDSIAFQTNILALNAAVEAARAGTQGRGFAVVASEVRNLAQHSATAAKEIKELIAESVSKVESGARLVQEAGSTMDEVVTSFQQVARLVTDISNASREQSSGIEQVTQAVSQMDEVTQQNTALVEEAAAAAESLEEQSISLVRAVGMFTLTEGQRQTTVSVPVLHKIHKAAPKQLGTSTRPNRGV